MTEIRYKEAMEDYLACIVCSDCLATTTVHTEAGMHLLKELGWCLDGEFGEICPICVAEYARPTQTEGIIGLADILTQRKS